MKVSIVLSSYNGEKYIVEQLQSILNQTRQPDEVMVADDGSSDATVLIVKNFIENHNLQGKWSLVVNKVNKGWKRNFMDSFHKATGDVIFSCDQDDVWDKEKIKKMTTCFEENPEIEVLGSNFEPFKIDSGVKVSISNGLTRKKVGVSFNKRLEKTRLDKLVLHTFVPGCSLAFRKDFLKYVDYVWYPDWAHDSVISTISKLRGTYFFLNEPLIQYRRHEGISTPKNIKTRGGRIDFSKSYLERIVKIEDNVTSLELEDKAKQLLQNLKDFHSTRINFFASNRWSVKAIKLFSYYNYYPSFYSFLGDFVIAIKNK